MAAGALVGLLMLPMWRSARTRNTNVDLVAGRLGTLAAAGDLVVIDPWYLSISFDRYYRGPAGRVTVPPMPASPIQQYDALKQAMTSSGAMASVLDAMRTSLREGHRVFWVGDLFMPRRGMVPGEPPPAPHPLYGWNDSFYYQAWGLQAGYLIQRHATSAEQIEVPESQAVNPFEYARLYVFSGWWEGASPQ
jgi:hypothetical protein